MKLYIVRHGETPWNIERKMQGRTDIPLNEFGKSLALKTGKGLQDIPFHVAYTSPLSRAKETADLILKERQCKLLEEQRIIEISFGEYEGLCCSKEGWNIPDPKFQNFFSDCEAYVPPKGGESFVELRNRVGSFLEELFQNREMAEWNILIVTHGATIKAMTNYIKKERIAKIWDGGVHKNCGVTIVEATKNKQKILEEGIVFYDDKVEIW